MTNQRRGTRTNPFPRGQGRPFLLGIIGVAALFLAGSEAQGRRADSFEFLTLPIGARAAALGGAGVADADGWAGSQINPAGLGRLWRDEIGFAGSRWLDDVQHQAVGGAHPFNGGGALAGTVLALDYGSIPSFGPSGGAEGTISAGGTAVRLGYGRAFRAGFDWGLQGTYARETLAGVSAQALAADGGLLWTPRGPSVMRSLTLGAALKNWGSRPQFENESANLPRRVQAGATVRPPIEGWTVSVDALLSPDQSPSVLAGMEYWARGAVAFRLGYNGGEAREGSGATVGFGFRAWNIGIDYAFVGWGGLGDAHHLGLTYRFGRPAEAYYQRGRACFQRGDYAQAVVFFARAVSLDPRHRRALEGLRDANAKLQKQEKQSPR